MSHCLTHQTHHSLTLSTWNFVFIFYVFEMLQNFYKVNSPEQYAEQDVNSLKERMY